MDQYLAVHENEICRFVMDVLQLILFTYSRSYLKT